MKVSPRVPHDIFDRVLIGIIKTEYKKFIIDWIMLEVYRYWIMLNARYMDEYFVESCVIFLIL